MDASIACRFQLRLTREDILEGSTFVFDPTDERLAPARPDDREAHRAEVEAAGARRPSRSGAT